MCPSALPSSASLLWAPSSPLCWVTWTKCLSEGKEQSWGWVSDLAPRVSSDLGSAIWSQSLNLPTLSFLIHKVGTAKPTSREAAAGCCEPRAGRWVMRAVPSPPPSGPLCGSHLAGVLLALAVAGAQHAGRHLVAVGLTAQVLRDQLHIHLLQAVAGGACGWG